MGEIILELTRKNIKCLIRGLILKGTQFHAILGKKACHKLELLKILDNDAINVIQKEHADPISRNKLITDFSEVFNERVGILEGTYKIQLKDENKPVKHAQRRVALPIQAEVKDKLDELEKKDIIRKVITPTQWISSMVIVKKKSGKIRICLDPKDLNESIERENSHYQRLKRLRQS